MHALQMIAIFTLALTACTDAEPTFGEQPYTLESVGQPAAPGERPQTMYFVIPPALDDLHPTEDVSQSTLSGEPTVIYLSRGGITLTPGFNDSARNRSSIIQSPVQIPRWNTSDATWNQVVACVREQFAPFHTVVTDVDPGDVDHIEAVVASRPEVLGLPSGVGGVSPFTSNCSTIPRSIVFTFAEVYRNNVQAICETTAQEVAHSFGLDHEYLCADPMTYLFGCGAKRFQDVDAPCGERDGPRECQCFGSTQNSVQMLLERVGPAPAADTTPPMVRITAPVAGATVEAGFTVNVEANDDTAVLKVELYIDGMLQGVDEAAPFSLTAGGRLAPGSHNVEVRAWDSAQYGQAAITVTVRDATDTGGGDTGGGGDNDTGGGDTGGGNDTGGGDTGGGDRGLGQRCTDSADCQSGLCASDGLDDRCVDRCISGDPASCPLGFDCIATGDSAVCWPAAGAADADSASTLTGGCGVSATPNAGAGLLLLGLLAVLRRRSPRSTRG